MGTKVHLVHELFNINSIKAKLFDTYFSKIEILIKFG